jgi:galactofuranose transport system permease protein
MTDLSLERRITFDRDRVLSWLQSYGVYAAIVVLVAIDTALSPRFFTLQNARVQLFQAVPVLLVALGMALVIGTEGIDLSVGAVIALAAALIPIMIGHGLVLTMIVVLIAGGVSGTIGGSMVAFARVQPIVATLALMIGLRGFAVIINGASAKPVNNQFIDDLGVKNWFGVPEMAFLAALVVAIVAFVVRRSTFGRQLMAIGDNRAASELSGTPVRRVLVLVYVICGILSALAGILIVGHGAEADPSGAGLLYELSAITAVVVGGTPLSGGKVKVVGTVAGAIFMQLVQATLIQHNVKNSWSQIIEAIIICFAVYAARGRSGR